MTATVRGTGFGSNVGVTVSECAVGSDGAVERSSCLAPNAAFTSADNGDFRVVIPVSRSLHASFLDPSPPAVDYTRAGACRLAVIAGEGDTRPVAEVAITVG